MASKSKFRDLDRACKRQDGVEVRRREAVDESGPDDQHQTLDPELWRELPVELAYKVLSFLPVDMLVDTLRSGNRKWERELLRFHTSSHEIFGHGKNPISSYGFVMQMKRKLLTLEHESMQWREFRMRPHKELRAVRFIDGSCDGLMLCESNKCLTTKLLTSRRQYICSGHEEVHCVKMGVWNPLFRAFKWLPLHPKLRERSFSEYLSTSYHVMVDEPSRTYKVFVIYTDSRTKTWLYCIYSSKSKSWSDCHPIPTVDFFDYKFQHSAASGEYVCIGRYDYSWPNTHSEYHLYCYDAEHGCWEIANLSKALTDLAFDRQPGTTLPLARISGFVILHGLLYMVVHIYSLPDNSNDGHPFVPRWSDRVLYENLLVSLDLSTLRAGDSFSPVLKLECIIPKLRFSVGCSWPDFDIYTYTMQGKGFVAVREFPGCEYFHFDTSSGGFFNHNPYPRISEVPYKNCFLFKPSFVVP